MDCWAGGRPLSRNPLHMPTAARYGFLMSTSRLVRPSQGKWIAGVCAGLADRFGISRSLVRLGFVIFGLVGAGEIAYIIAWIVMPKDD